MKRPVLEIASSPHVVSANSVETIMFNVVLALLPAVAFSIYIFGITAALTIGAAVVSCLLTEHLLCRAGGAQSTVGDWSAVITGLLLGLIVPPGLPVWMVAVGGFLSIGLGKYLFGGLGYNSFNPALVGRAVLQATFPVSMTTWIDAEQVGRFSELAPTSLAAPLTAATTDVVSGATPLAAWKFDRALADTTELAFGMVSGSAGETSALVLLLGGVYLIARNMMNWRTPVAILGTVAVVSAILHAIDPGRYPPAEFMLLSGGLMLGALFMATDMVGSPITNAGCVVYGILIGVLVLVIRNWGGMPEGVMYAILLGNAASPHIDKLIQPRVYGTQRERRASAGEAKA
ncbi:MAG: RnfABCDGE type electron transport complex subunit D [Deltaproteobacteria bacterium]|nr:RnfABCDGE type electron transport complex subunit D [Deltaproteobacteria bacterium]